MNTNSSTSKWEKKDNKWYYYEDGNMVTGWKLVDGKWYYLESNGVMAIGWKELGGIWYYLNESGAMVKGWQTISGKTYYFNDSGHMLLGKQTIDGKSYEFNGSGQLISDTGDISLSESTYIATGEVIDVQTILNVRKGPGTNYDSIGQLHQGDKVSIVAKNGEWYKISSPIAGYVHKDFVDISSKSIKEVTLKNWQEDCIERGWGPLTREAYVKKFNEYVSNNMEQFLLFNLKANKYDIKNPLGLLTSNNVGLFSVFVNEPTEKFTIYKFNESKTWYDTSYPGVIKEYYINEHGSRVLYKKYDVPEAKLHPIKEKLRMINSSELKVTFLKFMNKSLSVLGKGLTVFEDLINLINEGKVNSNEELGSAIAVAVVKAELVDLFCSEVMGFVTQVLNPELPLIGAVIGAAIGYTLGYIINLGVSHYKIEEILTDKLVWMFDSMDSWFN
ncbi:SH3 domain-containing protein [Clostridium perfringens]|uniref:SH3 domain-containing protein n=1 Tax=Clostridium perfringens TaxID=1502 RepID=UPI00311AB58E